MLCNWLRKAAKQLQTTSEKFYLRTRSNLSIDGVYSFIKVHSFISYVHGIRTEARKVEVICLIIVVT
ncbi:unnamed protein product [Trifolium pratense]|uniref:Uncharacterized protein n=1 Tax=Trifolium pratense TaxID=57577 RepID=A0ACB0JGN6_TRIPR|nr:unnamed protein product [Trifolium pratense]